MPKSKKATVITGTTVTAGAPNVQSNTRRRRSRRPQRSRAQTPALTAKTGQVKITTNTGQEVITVSPVVTTKVNRRRNRKMYGKEHMTQFSQLARHMPTNVYELMKSVISPAETDAPCGWPDAEMCHSVVLNKHMHAIKISKPPSFPDSEWSAVIMQVPSPEIAAIVWYCAGALTSDVPMPWVSNGPSTSVWLERQIIYWADVVDRITCGAAMPAAYGVGGINSEQEVNVVPDHDPDDTAEIVYPTWTTSFNEQVVKFRCMGFSNTITPSVNATNNQGIFYTRHVDSRVTLKNLSIHSAVYNAVDWRSFHAEVHGQNVVIDQLPPNLGAMLQSECYQGPLYEGTYTIGKISDELNYIDSNAGRGLLTLSQSNHLDTNPMELMQEIGFAEFPGVERHEAFWPILIAMDTAWQPTITVMQGAASNASLQMKLIAHFEAVPITNGAMTYMMSKPPPKNVVFLESVQAISSLIPEGAPASANTFWDVLKQIGSELWSVVKGVLPGILMAVL